MKLITFFIVLIFPAILLLTNNIEAQQISDVSFELIEEEIYIYYTLAAASGEEYETSAVLKRLNDASFSYVPEELSGDIGEGQYAGIDKTIIWDVSEEEFGMFDGEDFYFEIMAEKVPDSGGIPWYYYVGTAVIGGGVAAVLLLGGDNGGSSSESTTEFPSPPGRP